LNEEEQITLLTQRVDKLEQEVLQLKRINEMTVNTETVKTEPVAEKTGAPRTMPILSKSVSISMLSTEEILNKSSDSEKASEKN